MRDVDLGHERGLLGGRRQHHVLAVLDQNWQPPPRRTIVRQNAVEERRAVALHVEARRVVEAATDAGARRVAVEIRAGRAAPQPLRDRRLRHRCEVHDVARRIVERHIVDGGAVIEGGDDLAEPFARRPPRLHQGKALRQHQQIVLVEIGKGLSRVEVLVPGLEVAVLERRAPPVHRDPGLAVPLAAVARKDHGHGRPLVALIRRDGEVARSVIGRLWKHQVRRVGEVLLVVAGTGDDAVDGAIEANVEPFERLTVDGDPGLLSPTRRRADLASADVARRRQQGIT